MSESELQLFPIDNIYDHLQGWCAICDVHLLCPLHARESAIERVGVAWHGYV